MPMVPASFDVSTISLQSAHQKERDPNQTFTWGDPNSSNHVSGFLFSRMGGVRWVVRWVVVFIRGVLIMREIHSKGVADKVWWIDHGILRRRVLQRKKQLEIERWVHESLERKVTQLNTGDQALCPAKVDDIIGQIQNPKISFKKEGEKARQSNPRQMHLGEPLLREFRTRSNASTCGRRKGRRKRDGCARSGNEKDPKISLSFWRAPSLVKRALAALILVKRARLP